MRWSILTGEYPPQLGGVSDYTRLVAVGLARAGDEVEVWAPRCEGVPPMDPGVVVHRLPDRFSLRGLLVLDRAFSRSGRVDRLLVQYVPHAFGCKAMNIPFCLWLATRPSPKMTVIFHEVAMGFRWGQPIARNALAFVTSHMAARVHRAAVRTFVTIPAWEEMLRRVAGSNGHPVAPLPVPSTIPTAVDGRQVARIRKQLAPRDGCAVVAHFGTFPPFAYPVLFASIELLLETHPERSVLLVGRNSERFAHELVARHPALADRIHATGLVSHEQVANHLAAADVLLQPYPDGVSGRRTTVMAGLALGLPIVTTAGFLTEPLWAESGALELVPADDPRALADRVERLLADSDRRRVLGARARVLYASHFAIERTIARLRDPS